MISAKMNLHSVDSRGLQIATMEVVMPRYILAEGKTHRILSGALQQVTVEQSIGFNDEVDFSKNSASSRAIPLNKTLKSVQDTPFIPYAWQKDHKGMQGFEYFNKKDSEHHIRWWLKGRDDAISTVVSMNEWGQVTKQLCNRLLEPYMYHRVLITATEWENFFELRCPSYSIENDNPKTTTYRSWKDLQKAFPTIITGKEDTLTRLRYNKGQADIHMMELAECMWDCLNDSTPTPLKELRLLRFMNSSGSHNPDNPEPIENLEKELDELRCKISTARCARISYQTLGDNPIIDYAKDLDLFEILKSSGHWSPFEHVAKAMTAKEYKAYVKGKMPTESTINVPTDDMKGWCRNFRGYIQYRDLLD